MQSAERIIVALDGLELDRALAITRAVGPFVHAVKVHHLWDEEGPGVVAQLKAAGACRVMLDLKLNDVPRTMARRAAAAKRAGADYLTVMAEAEVDAMMAAVEHGPTVIAVTVLTSQTDAQVEGRCGRTSAGQALYLARLARLAGVEILVCSAQEVQMLGLRPELKAMQRWTPGIRRAGQDPEDQRRTDTPQGAVHAGASRIIIGAAIVGAPDPVAAFHEIAEEIEAATAAP